MARLQKIVEKAAASARAFCELGEEEEELAPGGTEAEVRAKIAALEQRLASAQNRWRAGRRADSGHEPP